MSPKYYFPADPSWRERQLFRYLRGIHVLTLQEEGRLRVKKQHSYQTIGDIRQDSTEGTKSTFIQGPGYFTGPQAKAILGFNVHSVTVNDGGLMRFQHKLSLPPAYMVSTSATRGTHLLNRFGVNDYFTITNVELFLTILAREIYKQIKIEIVAFDKVTYVRQKSRTYTMPQAAKLPNTIHSVDVAEYFKKTLNYAVEAEYRFLFLTDAKDAPEYLDLQLPLSEVHACCHFNHEMGTEPK
ncbi:MAG: hypothetical protein IPM27_02205 [Nitrosomonadales bacterium]|nr:hypothetical protein [Nitrosomonadales bacterium]